MRFGTGSLFMAVVGVVSAAALTLQVQDGLSRFRDAGGTEGVMSSVTVGLADALPKRTASLGLGLPELPAGLAGLPSPAPSDGPKSDSEPVGGAPLPLTPVLRQDPRDLARVKESDPYGRGVSLADAVPGHSVAIVDGKWIVIDHPVVPRPGDGSRPKVTVIFPKE